MSERLDKIKAEKCWALTDGDVKWLIAEVERLEAEAREDNLQLVIGAAKIARLEIALVKIAKGEGAFSRDELTHARNTVENMKDIAAAEITREAGEDNRSNETATRSGEVVRLRPDAGAKTRPTARVQQSVSPASRTFSQALDAIHKAGGDAWDKVTDVGEALGREPDNQREAGSRERTAPAAAETSGSASRITPKPGSLAARGCTCPTSHGGCAGKMSGCPVHDPRPSLDDIPVADHPNAAHRDGGRAGDSDV